MGEETTRSTDASILKILGERLLKLRRRRGLSLRAVEEMSGGALRGAVLGSYERGERAATVPKLAAIAKFYDVPLEALVSGKDLMLATRDEGRVVLDLDALRTAPGEAKHLVSLVAGLQDLRGDFGSRVLTPRRNDVVLLARIYGISYAELYEQMASWGVLVDQRYYSDGSQPP